MATHSSILAWEIPWTDTCGGLVAKSCPILATHFTHSNVYFNKHMLTFLPQVGRISHSTFTGFLGESGTCVKLDFHTLWENQVLRNQASCFNCTKCFKRLCSLGLSESAWGR